MKIEKNAGGVSVFSANEKRASGIIDQWRKGQLRSEVFSSRGAGRIPKLSPHKIQNLGRNTHVENMCTCPDGLGSTQWYHVVTLTY